jgi:uncharacterized phage protein (TIGR01671 family)
MKKESRGILFRAWDRRNKAMYLNPFNGKLGGINDILADTGDWIYMQYIGKTDKNSANMYESDIVNTSNASKTNISSGKVSICASFELGEIVYNPEDTRYEVLVKKQKEARYDGKMPYINPLRYKPWEVIGNIYENPELLK